MAVNLYRRDASIEISIQRIGKAFGSDALWAFKPTAAGNTIVLAFHTPRDWDKNTLLLQAEKIQTRWSLPAQKWLQTLAPTDIRN
jgi:spermidine synthase